MMELDRTGGFIIFARTPKKECYPSWKSMESLFLTETSVQPLALNFVTSWKGVTSGSLHTYIWGWIWQLKYINKWKKLSQQKKEHVLFATLGHEWKRRILSWIFEQRRHRADSAIHQNGWYVLRIFKCQEHTDGKDQAQAEQRAVPQQQWCTIQSMFDQAQMYMQCN